MFQSKTQSLAISPYKKDSNKNNDRMKLQSQLARRFDFQNKLDSDQSKEQEKQLLLTSNNIRLHYLTYNFSARDCKENERN